MFFGMLVMVITLYCFSLEMIDRKNNILITNYILGTKNTYNDKIYSLNALSKYLITNVSQLDDAGIKNYMISNVDSFKIISGKSCINYDGGYDCFIVANNFNGYFHKEELYYYKVIESCIKFYYKETRYVEGRVNT